MTRSDAMVGTSARELFNALIHSREMREMVKTGPKGVEHALRTYLADAPPTPEQLKAAQEFDWSTIAAVANAFGKVQSGYGVT